MMIILSIMILILSYVLFSTEEELDIKMMFYIIWIVLPLIIIIVFLSVKIIFKRLEKLRLLIDEYSIKRIYMKNTEEIIFKNLKSLFVKRDKSGNIVYIKIKAEKKNITVYGFENIRQIYCLLEKNIDKSQITESKYRINWNSNLVIIMTMIFTFCIILAMIKLNIYDIFAVILMLGLSIIYFIYKPLSKSYGTNHKKYDGILAVIFFLSGIIMLINFIIK